MPTYKLSYFDMDGGRAEPIRIAFHSAGIAFEDERVAFPDFGKFRETTPFNTVPVLEIDGIEVNIISLKQLKINKKASGRHKDLDDFEMYVAGGAKIELNMKAEDVEIVGEKGEELSSKC